jgi:hypothetical protein
LPLPLNALGFDVSTFKVIAIKSRVHFRRGFDDSGLPRPFFWSNWSNRSWAEKLLPLWRAEVATRVVPSEAKDLMPFQRACRLQSQ